MKLANFNHSLALVQCLKSHLIQESEVEALLVK